MTPPGKPEQPIAGSHSAAWYILPLLVFNLALAASLPGAYADDSLVPPWLVYLEHGLRVPVFFGPLLLRARFERLGLMMYAAGILLYFGSWLPLIMAPSSAWSLSGAGGLAPAYSPALPLLAVGRVTSSRWYAVGCVAFLLVHVLATSGRLSLLALAG